jgi:CTP:molybdopterin cytidylyltransferase MocA
MHVVAVLLAAGEGRRLGGSKALLRLRGMSFLQACLAALDRPAIAERIVITGHDAARVAAEVPLQPGVRVAHNPLYRDGMLGSVLRGLGEAEALGADALLLHPVDHPLVETATIDAVISALEDGALVAVPSHEGRRGHPGGFARAAWPALRAATPEEGARAVLRDHPQWVVHVRGGPGCVAGFNTPADLARLAGGGGA